MPDTPTSSAAARREQILEIFSREVGIEPERLRPEATIKELEIASLDIVQAIFALEERFDVQIPEVPDRAGSEFTTVGDLFDHVNRTLDRSDAQRRAAAAGGSPASGPAGAA